MFKEIEDFRNLSVRCRKNGKRYLPLSEFGRFCGRGDGVIGELASAGLVRRNVVEGFKLRMPVKLFAGQKFGRVLWLCRGSDLPDGENGFMEATPEYCLTKDGAEEFLRQLRLRKGDSAVAAADEVEL